MPNWCNCSVTFDCSDELFDEICSYVKSENNIFDFGKVIPMPEDIYHGDLGQAEREKYGKNNWYDWSIENWGTKWNSEGASLYENTFTFDTAWSPCSPVIITLAKRFSDAHIRFQYSEPGWGFCGVEEYRGGYKIYQLEGDYYEIWPEGNEDGTRTNIDEDKLPLSDKTIDYYLDEKECGLLVKTGKLYYREKIDDEYIVEIVADVIFVDKLPENIWE